MTEILREHGMRLLLADSGFSVEEEELVAALLARRPEAVYLTGVIHSPATRRLLPAVAFPVVETGNLAHEPIDMLVSVSNREAANAVTRILIEAGRRRIGYVGQVGRHSIDRVRDRFGGYRAALAQHRLPTAAGRQVDTEPSYNGGAVGLPALMAQAPDTDAIFCSSDVIGFGALFEPQRLGIAFPERLGIMGFDDQELSSHCVPALSTVRVPRYAWERVAGEMICRRIAGHPVGERVVDLSFVVVLRGTT
jgi:LacI family gluconate utilization system Gnt-I transcriptional repressor